MLEKFLHERVFVHSFSSRGTEQADLSMANETHAGRNQTQPHRKTSTLQEGGEKKRKEKRRGGGKDGLLSEVRT